MQQGILFHTLYTPEAGIYCEQWCCTLHGTLHVAALEQAWKQIVNRHPVLRTAFNWENRDEPFQVVYRRVELPWSEHDWQTVTEVEQERDLETFLTADRAQGFQLAKAPLMRLTLIRMAENTYQFVWSYHHLLLDGWSLSILLDEVFQFYEALCEGRELRLQVCRPYGDYIAWLQQQSLFQAEMFWRHMLRGFTEPICLNPGRDINRLVSGKLDYAEEQIYLSEATTTALRTLVQHHTLSLNTLLQGVWALLLSRYSGQEDVVFGAVVAGRPTDLAGVEAMIGLFINTLPVRVKVVPDAWLLPWLQELQAQQVEARQYEYSPLVQVQAWSEAPPGLPLFESILVFENGPLHTSLQAWEGSLTLRHIRLVSRTNYPLTVYVVPGPELKLRINYQSHCFDAATVTHMLGHIQSLLQGIVANPRRRLAELPLLTQTERHQLLMEWNDTYVAYPQDACLHGLFESQVERTPDAVAVMFEDHKLTYRELNQRANQLAHYLRAAGVGPDFLVGLCMERSLEMVLGLLGILKAGGAYVPLDPAYPRERLAFMMEDTQLSVLLTQERFVAQLPVHGPRIVCLDTHWQRIAQTNDTNPTGGARSHHLAYVIYTSGSTGKPKGTMISHRSLCNLLLWMQDTYDLSAQDRVLQSTPFIFDVSTWEFFWPLVTGARLVVARPEGHRDSNYLVELIAAQQITTAHFVPSMLRMFLEEPDVKACKGLRLVMCSGEALPLALQERFFARLDATLHNLYGPTETAVYATCWTCDRQSNWQTVPIGRPIANTQTYVLDAHLQPVPVGVAGELHIAGAGLSSGYLNRPGLTAKKFVCHPLSSEAGARLYKTGDRVRYLPDGNIEFLGRLDQQVKIRGHRIELGEIESTLELHPAIHQSVVQVYENPSGDKRLVAYVVSDQEPASIVHNLRGFLQTKLPVHMIPAAFVWLDTLPFTPSGKVDRRALPTPDQARPALAEEFIAPRTPIEEILLGIWTTVLGIEAIGVHDNFFDLGGHSLLAIQVMSRLRRTFHVEIPLRVLFDAPTIANLALHIWNSSQNSQTSSVPSLGTLPREEPAPATPIQEHLWALDRLLPGAPFSNVPFAMRLTGVLNLEALEHSFNEIIERHETLRTTFASADGRPVQIISSSLYLSLATEDLRALPLTEREIETQRRIREAALHFFDLLQGPLLHLRLLRLDDEEHILLVTMHHIISDAWSMDVLLHEIDVLYDAFSHGNLSPLPPLAIQYADFAHWQHQWLHSEARDAQLAYWQKQLRTPLPLLELPTDHHRTDDLSLSTSRYAFQISKDLCTVLRRFSHQEGTTLFMTLLTAFKALLYSYTGQEDIRVGTLVANRQYQETEGLIGLFANLVVLRTNLKGDPTLQEVLQRVRTTALTAYMHQELPFEHLARTLHREDGIDRHSLFQVMFVLQNANPYPQQLATLKLDVLETFAVEASACDIAITLRESSQGLHGFGVYRTALFDSATITRLLDDFQQLLQDFVVQPGQALSTFSSLRDRDG